MIKQFIVSRIETKSGVTNNKPWTFYLVYDEQGNKYQANSAEWLKKIGQPVAPDIEERPSKKLDKNGRPYINLVIVEPKQYKPKSGPSAEGTKVLNEILGIAVENNQLLESIVARLDKKETPF